MTAEMIRTMLRIAPFVPFTIHLSDGRSVRVPHPDFAWLMQNGQILFVNTEGDTVQRVDVSQITSIESVEKPAASESV